MAGNQEIFWTFVNSKDPTQVVTVLGHSSAQFFYSRFSKEEIKQWFVKSSEWDTMRPLVDCKDFEKNGDFAIRSIDVTGVVALLSVPKEKNETFKQKSENRREKRLPAKMKVLIIFEDKVFKGYTKNISQGGLCLDKSVPDNYVGKDCRLLIASADNRINIEFKSRLKEVSERGTRLQFKGSQSEESLNLLSAWMTEFEQQLASPQRKVA